MKFGVREICDVVLRAKTAQKIGNKIFYKNEPVCYFDTLKTSTMEGAATTVYAQGGRGNARLMSWDGERTVTFTMEDALISPVGLSILTGAGLIEASEDKEIIQHITETVEKKNNKFYIKKKPYIPDSNDAEHGKPTIYGMILDENGEVTSEPYLLLGSTTQTPDGFEVSFPGTFTGYEETDNPKPKAENSWAQANIILVDYYTAHETGAFQIDISAEKFGGTFYLEASTLWRDQATKKDLPAEFIIPACRVQSNFTFSMSSSGDPSTFTFTMDAFPDFTRWNRTEKVLATIQVIGANFEGVEEPSRDQTWSQREFNDDGTLNDNAKILYDAPTISAFSYNKTDSELTVTINPTIKLNTEALDPSESYTKIKIVVYNTVTGEEVFSLITLDTNGDTYYIPLAAGTYNIRIEGFADNRTSKVGTGTPITVTDS